MCTQRKCSINEIVFPTASYMRARSGEMTAHRPYLPGEAPERQMEKLLRLTPRRGRRHCLVWMMYRLAVPGKSETLDVRPFFVPFPVRRPCRSRYLPSTSLVRFHRFNGASRVQMRPCPCQRNTINSPRIQSTIDYSSAAVHSAITLLCALRRAEILLSLISGG